MARNARFDDVRACMAYVRLRGVQVGSSRCVRADVNALPLIWQFALRGSAGGGMSDGGVRTFLGRHVGLLRGDVKRGC